jgi:hypothetical protein
LSAARARPAAIVWAVAAALTVAFVSGAQAASPGGDGAGTTVALIVPVEIHGRLAEELRRELEASQFSVLSLPPAPGAPGAAEGGDGARAAADRLLGGARPAGAGPASADARLIAVIAADQGQVTIYARPATPGEPLQATLLKAQEDDRPARRRLCLAVVEYLRRIGPVAPVPTPAPPAVTATVVVTTNAPPPAVSPERRPWAFGVASDLNILSARGTPTAHVTLMAERLLRGPVTLATRMAWPILGAQFTDDDGRFIRTWTFAGEVGLHVRLRAKTAALRPIIGTAVGLRLSLADTDEFEMRASRIVMTPALSLAVSAGLRYRIRPLVDLIVATDVSQGLLLLTDRRDYEAATARERLVRLSLGVLFEY